MSTTPSTPEQLQPNHTVLSRTNMNSAKPKTMNSLKKKGKKRKNKKQSYKDMMAAITRPSMSIAEKIQEKREGLKTASAEPPKLVTI